MGAAMILAAAPLVWTLHFLAVYVLVSVACRLHSQWLVLPGVALLTVAAVAAYGWLALPPRGAGAEARQFITATHRLLCLLAAIGTAWVAYPAFMLPACAS
jgi:hypothetical protein